MSSDNEHLDESGNLEVCGEVVETETDPCIENPNGPGCGGPGNSPPIPPNPTPSEPFLAPYKTIQVGENELVSTTRELNVFNRKLFFNGNGLLETEGSDQIRYLARALWSWDKEQEVFMERPNHVSVEVEDEAFVSPQSAASPPKHWSGKLKVTFANSLQEYTDALLFLGRSIRSEPDCIDTVFASPQPFFESEMENVVFASSNTVTIKPEVGYYEEKPHVPETSLTSLYRAYYKLKNPSEVQCDIVEDSIQKFTSDSMDMMKEANELMKRSFNQYVEITINTKQGGKISEFADEFQMDKYFLELVASNHMQEIEYAEILDETRSRPDDGTGSTREEAFPNDRYYPSIPERTSPDPLYGLIRTIKNWTEETFETSLNHNQYPLKYEYHNNIEALRFTDIIRSQIFMNRMESQVLSPNKVRSVSDIFSGKKAYAETIGYKVAKHEVTVSVDASGQETYEVKPEPIQEFYFMDSNKVLDIQFVDTQVNAGKSYVYRIHSINFVLGSRLYYFDASGKRITDTDGQVNVSFQSFIHSTIIEAPYFEKFVSVVEKPPLAPQVSFVPLKGKDDEMEILLTSNFGEEFRAPIKIFQSDQAIIDRMIESQPQRDPVILEYQTDSLPVEFQILRLESPPESYNDFATTDFVKTLPTSGRSLIYKDKDFLPNKDYYYCFRAIDKIGISNPSQVYKVRINSYVNGIYLDIKQYEMRPLVDTSFNLSIKRALKIEPTFDHRALSFVGVEDIDTPQFATSVPPIDIIKIGKESESVWGKNFKIRLTSKHTGKRVDINVTFDKAKKDIFPEDPTIDMDLITPSTPCGTAALDLRNGNEEVLARYDPSVGLAPDDEFDQQTVITRAIEAEESLNQITIDSAELVPIVPNLDAMAIDLGGTPTNNVATSTIPTPRMQVQSSPSVPTRTNSNVNINVSRNVRY